MKQLIYILLMTVFCTLFGLNSYSAKSDSIQIVIDHNQNILPDRSFNIGVIDFKRNGKIKNTIGLLNGTKFWWNYSVKVIGGSHFNGKIKIDESLVPSKGKTIKIEIHPKNQPELLQTVTLPLNYETKLDFFATNQFDKAPGEKVEGKIVTFYNNQQHEVYTKLKKKKEASNFNFLTNGGYWKDGIFEIATDIREIHNHEVGLIVQAKNNLAASDTFAFQLDYKHNYNLSFNGQNGMNGQDGWNGIDGSSGKYGEDGENGENAYFGEHGPEIGVWVDLYHDSILNAPLLYIYAENFYTGEEFYYLVNPNGGSFTVSSNGGNGGRGGDGGNGGDGGKGENGKVWIEKKTIKVKTKKPFKEKKIVSETKTIVNDEGKEEKIKVEKEITVTVYKEVEEEKLIEIKRQGPGQNGGNGGWGGAGGLGGIGGNGGTIFLHFTEDAFPYQNRIIAESQGGSGGLHGDGGDGGQGGKGGDGKPNGRDGRDGRDGPEAFGWADDGYDGEVIIAPSDEFFFYETSSIIK